MIKNKHKIISAVLAAVAVMSAASVSAADISPTRSYNGQFSDVSSSAWYYDSVSGAYSLGLISGVDDTHFSPDGTITIAQAVKLAASCHQLLTDGKTTGACRRQKLVRRIPLLRREKRYRHRGIRQLHCSGNTRSDCGSVLARHYFFRLGV